MLIQILKRDERPSVFNRCLLTNRGNMIGSFERMDEIYIYRSYVGKQKYV